MYMQPEQDINISEGVNISTLGNNGSMQTTSSQSQGAVAAGIIVSLLGVGVGIAVVTVLVHIVSFIWRRQGQTPVSRNAFKHQLNIGNVSAGTINGTTHNMPLKDNLAYGQTTPQSSTEDNAAYRCGQATEQIPTQSNQAYYISSQIPTVVAEEDPVYNVIIDDELYDYIV